MNTSPPGGAPQNGAATTAQIATIRRALSTYRRRQMSLGNLVPAAVTIPLVPHHDGIHILFTMRTHTVEHHKGEISFPGGRRDESDAAILDVALRETWEEVGIPPQDMEVIGALDDFESISGYHVTPFVTLLDRPDPALTIEPGEVSRIICVPLTHLCDPQNHSVDRCLHPTEPVHFFHWKDLRIWGLTGAILHQLLSVAFNFESA